MSGGTVALVAAAATALTGAAVLLAAVVLARTHRPTLALGVGLDVLLAAGLLRLSGDVSWRQVATAAALVALRHLITRGLRAGGAERGRRLVRPGRVPPPGGAHLRRRRSGAR